MACLAVVLVDGGDHAHAIADNLDHYRSSALTHQ